MAPHDATRGIHIVPDLPATPALPEKPVRRGRKWSGSGPVRLSIIMPAFNEEATIAHAVASVMEMDYPCEVEVIVVNDGSTDATQEILASLTDQRVRVVAHPRNLGKGAAILTGVAVATGTHVLPFDADLEYSPEDIPRMLEPIIKGRCDVVYGTRMFGQNTVFQSYKYAAGNRAMTRLANILYDSYISDLHTCLKLIPTSLFRSFDFRETGFGLDTEVTATILRAGVRPFEVPVSYHSRSHAEGKKITWRDGVQCVRILGRVRVASNRLCRAAVVMPAPPEIAVVPIETVAVPAQIDRSCLSRSVADAGPLVPGMQTG